MEETLVSTSSSEEDSIVRASPMSETRSVDDAKADGPRGEEALSPSSSRAHRRGDRDKSPPTSPLLRMRRKHRRNSTESCSSSSSAVSTMSSLASNLLAIVSSPRTSGRRKMLAHPSTTSTSSPPPPEASLSSATTFSSAGSSFEESEVKKESSYVKNFKAGAAALLRDDKRWSSFHDYVVKVRRSPETVVFIESVLAYTKIEDEAQRTKRAEAMVEMFIVRGSPLELNIAATLREKILSTREWTSSSFEEVYDVTWDLICVNFYDDFARGEERLRRRAARCFCSGDGGGE